MSGTRRRLTSGFIDDLHWLRDQLNAAYEIKTQIIGNVDGMDRECKVLNRIVRCTSAGWEFEGDPRHAELVIEQLGLDGVKGTETPGVNGNIDPGDNDPLTGADITMFRGVIAR